MSKKIDWQKWDEVSAKLDEQNARIAKKWAQQNKRQPQKYTYSSNLKSYGPSWIIKALRWILNTAVDVSIGIGIYYIVFHVVPGFIDSIPVYYL